VEVHVAKRTGDDEEQDGATRQEVIDALLHPDRSRSDELGRTEDDEQQKPASSTPSSPREQPAAPIDMTDVDE
jgi:hypothetical protein